MTLSNFNWTIDRLLASCDRSSEGHWTLAVQEHVKIHSCFRDTAGKSELWEQLKITKKSLQRKVLRGRRENWPKEGGRLDLDFLLDWLAGQRKVLVLFCKSICLQVHRSIDTKQCWNCFENQAYLSPLAGTRKKDVESLWRWHCDNEADTLILASLTFFQISPHLLFRFLSFFQLSIFSLIPKHQLQDHHSSASCCRVRCSQVPQPACFCGTWLGRCVAYSDKLWSFLLDTD